VGSSFDDSIQEFRQFLDKFHYPRKVIWIAPQDVLLTGSQLIYIKVPVASNNAERARQLFNLNLKRQQGVHFEAICAIEDTTYAYAWLSRDDAEAEQNLIGNGLKMSVPAGAYKGKGETVRNLLHWSYLRLKLWKRQHGKDWMFRNAAQIFTGRVAEDGTPRQIPMP
jgi:hypothetical protein